MNLIINEKLTIGDRTTHNRLVIQPMEGCDGENNGAIGELTRRRYLRFAESGAGIIWFEAVAVTEEGKANPRQLWLKEDNAEGFKSLIKEIKIISREKFGYEPLIIMQATHSGRYAKPCGVPAPIVAYRNSVYEVGKSELAYHVITDDECDLLVEKFTKSAKLAMEVGFDGIDIKCCHGYLLNEFLCAYDRVGKYGGSFENRTALYFAIIDAVNAVALDKIFVTTRLSAYDGFDYPYGFGVNSENKVDLNETKRILSILQKKGIELINITIGNPYLLPSINRPYIGGNENGMIGVARMVNITGQLQKAFPTLRLVMSAMTFPGVNSIDHANKCIADGDCSLVGFGRMAFAYPDFYPDYLKNGTLDKNKICLTCGNCSKMMRAGLVAGCPVRDCETYLDIFKKCTEKKL